MNSVASAAHHPQTSCKCRLMGIGRNRARKWHICGSSYSEVILNRKAYLKYPDVFKRQATGLKVNLPSVNRGVGYTH